MISHFFTVPSFLAPLADILSDKFQPTRFPWSFRCQKRQNAWNGRVRWHGATNPYIFHVNDAYDTEEFTKPVFSHRDRSKI